MLPPETGAPDVTLLRHVRLSVTQARALAAELERFARSDQLPDQDAGQPYGVLLSLYRADIPVLPAE